MTTQLFCAQTHGDCGCNSVSYLATSLLRQSSSSWFCSEVSSLHNLNAGEDMSSTKVRWDPLISPALPLSGASQVVQRERSGLQCRNCSFDPWVRRSPGEGNGNTLQYSCLENPMDRGAWQGTVHRAEESQRGLRTHLILFQAALSCYCGFSPGSWL